MRDGEKNNNNESRLIKCAGKELFFFGGFENEKRTPIKQFDVRMRPETRNDDLMCDNLGWRREKNAKGKMTKKMLLRGIWVIADFVLGIFERGEWRDHRTDES